MTCSKRASSCDFHVGTSTSYNYCFTVDGNNHNELPIFLYVFLLLPSLIEIFCKCANRNHLDLIGLWANQE